MAISLAAPLSPYMVIGIGQRVILNGLSSVTIGDVIGINVENPTDSVSYFGSIQRTTSTSSSFVATMGIIDVSAFGPLPNLPAGNSIAGADGASAQIHVLHMSSAFSILESATFTGYTIDNSANAWGLLRQLQLDIRANGSDLSALASDIAAIKAAVLHVYTNA